MIPSSRVAIIDDDEDMRRSLATMVELFGYRTCLFENAASFFEWNRAETAQCIICDIQMPGMSGLELCMQLTRTGDRTPVILISGFATASMRRRALAAGARFFLAKPLDTGALVDLLNGLLTPRS